MKPRPPSLKRFLAILFLGIGSVAAIGQGTVWWDESVNGPLSTATTAPTLLAPLVGGSNTIFGTITRADGISVNDYFTFILPASTTLRAMWLSGDAPFQLYTGDAGYVSGTYRGVLTTGGVSGSQVLPTGQHWAAVLFNGAGANTVNYRLDFVATVPEPSTWLLSFIGLAVFFSLRVRETKTPGVTTRRAQSTDVRELPNRTHQNI